MSLSNRSFQSLRDFAEAERARPGGSPELADRVEALARDGVEASDDAEAGDVADRLAALALDVARDLERERGASAALEAAHAQRLRAQTLEALERLAGGVAHDFNNLLMVILSYAEILRAELASEPTASADVEQVRIAGERAADLARHLLAFSRKQVLEPRELDLDAFVSSMARPLRALLGDGVRLTVASSEPCRCVVDPGKLERVLLDLAENARDAMPDGGSLTVEARGVDVDDALAAALGVAPGAYARLAVRDSGRGIAPSVAARLFEPFFTTKEKGHGRGLALASAFGVARQSRGTIRALSEPGAGATFEVYLPRAAPRPA